MEFETKAIHTAQEPDPTTGATITPIYQTSTYTQDALGKHKGFEYSRTGNPTRTVLESVLAALENGKYGLCFSSGSGATTTLLSMLKAGDEIVACDDLYGGTIRLFNRVFSNFNIKTNYVDGRDFKNFETAITKNTKLIWLETPTNPMLRLCDIKAISQIAKSKNLILVVDNTFATPYFQKPLDLGADVVVHSTTKYIGGHSDVVGGAVIINEKELYEKVRFFQNAVGATPGAFDSWLVLRGVKTLAVRMKKHEETAVKIADFLEKHSKIKEVYYPGLKSNPQYDLAKKQMTGFGGMVSFKVNGGKEFAKKVIESTKLFALAESLGGVESLINFPFTMTHAGVPPEHKAKLGITEDLIRLSIGIEDGSDLIEDLKQALT